MFIQRFGYSQKIRDFAIEAQYVFWKSRTEDAMTTWDDLDDKKFNEFCELLIASDTIDEIGIITHDELDRILKNRINDLLEWAFYENWDGMDHKWA